MITLDFEGAGQNPADFTPDYEVPTNFQAGEVSGIGTFAGDGVDINSGWITTTLSGVNIFSETTWSASGNSSHSRGPMFVNPSGNGYLLLIRGSDIRFFLLNGGTLTQLGTTVAQSIAANDSIKLEYKGAGEFIYYYNGVQVGTHTDTTVTTDLRAGFVCRDAGAHLESFSADAIGIVLPEIRKGGTATFDKPAGIGTITSVTLNAAAITLDSQTASTFTVTDSDGTITTSGTYDLVATGDTVETIQVQVNVAGIASHTFQKDGAGLANLTDVRVAAFNSAGTLIVPQTTTTTDASAVIPKQDFSDVSEAVGDTIIVSVYSSTAATGITFEQALELI